MEFSVIAGDGTELLIGRDEVRKCWPQVETMDEQIKKIMSAGTTLATRLGRRAQVAQQYQELLQGKKDKSLTLAEACKLALVAWKGYEDSSATWKDLEELYLEAKEVVDEMFSSEWDGNKISKALYKEYERLQDEHA